MLQLRIIRISLWVDGEHTSENHKEFDFLREFDFLDSQQCWKSSSFSREADTERGIDNEVRGSFPNPASAFVERNI